MHRDFVVLIFVKIATEVSFNKKLNQTNHYHIAPTLRKIPHTHNT